MWDLDEVARKLSRLLGNECVAGMDTIRIKSGTGMTLGTIYFDKDSDTGFKVRTTVCLDGKLIQDMLEAA